MQKAGIIARAHVDATWHARPRGSAMWTRAIACVASGGDTWNRCLDIYIYYKYNIWVPRV